MTAKPSGPAQPSELPKRFNELVGHCPFCGSRDVYFARSAPPEVWRVKCGACGACGPEGRLSGSTPFEAAALMWRTRAHTQLFSSDFHVDAERGRAKRIAPRTLR